MPVASIVAPLLRNDLDGDHVSSRVPVLVEMSNSNDHHPASDDNKIAHLSDKLCAVGHKFEDD